MLDVGRVQLSFQAGLFFHFTHVVFGAANRYTYSFPRFCSSPRLASAFFTRVRKKDLLPCTLVSLATASAFIFGFLSLVYTTATSAGFLMALAVVIAPFLSIPLLKEKLDARNLVPVAIVVVGMYCICGGTFFIFRAR